MSTIIILFFIITYTLGFILMLFSLCPVCKIIEILDNHNADCSKIRLQSQSIMSRFVLHYSGAMWGDVTGIIKVFPLRSEISVMRPPRQHRSICLAFSSLCLVELQSLGTLQLLHGISF